MQYGTVILVKNENQENWKERILVTMTADKFVCVSKSTEEAYKEGKDYTVTSYEMARKLPDTYYVWEHLSDDSSYIIQTIPITDERAARDEYAELGYIKNEASARTWYP